MPETQEKEMPECLQRKERIRRDYEWLMECSWSTDSQETQLRLEVLRFLEKELKKDFHSTHKLREIMDAFFSGDDRRKLPVHERIKRARRKRHLTQGGLAKQLGFKGHSAINQFEKGKRRPTQNVVDWLAEAEGCRPINPPPDQAADPESR